MKPIYLLLLFSTLSLAVLNANAAGSAALRIVCNDDAAGAEVYINGKFKGECPLDIKVLEGTLKLRVKKTVDADHEPRLFEQEIRMGDGVMKKIEVQFSPLELNAAGKQREAARPLALAISSISTNMVVIPSKNYEMGKYEVTQGQWRAVMGNNPSHFAQCGDDCPVEQVSWNDIQEFLSKLNKATGRQYRLPSEVEWEYACSGSSRTEYCGGDDVNTVAWYGGNSDDRSHQVGQKQANGYGLHDMSGNVREWTNDCVEGACGTRVFRGGAWNIIRMGMSAAARFGLDVASRYHTIGFRLARTLP